MVSPCPVPSIWYVHGAGASSRSFAWLQTQLPPHQVHLFEYAQQDSVEGSIARLRTALTAQPGIVIGHSLGGLIAAGVASEPACRAIVTLAAPFGGLSVAMLLMLISRDQILRDLLPMNPLLRRLRTGLLESNKPLLPIVGTNGLSFLPGANDGVISVESQTAIAGAEYIRLPVTHFEILLSDDVVQAISVFMATIEWAEID